MTGRDLRSAKPSLDENNRPAVSFTLTSDGSRKFGKATGENIGRSLAIVLDKRVRSAPRIDGRITDQGTIYGSFTTEEVNDLSLTLRSGALPAILTYLEERVIGPSLGADSIRSGVIASLAGLIAGRRLHADLLQAGGRQRGHRAACMNLVILLGLMAYIGATMTLPGIAGFVLTMGIGVDSNVLIFERIKEELEAQRGVRASINAGFGRVFWTLLDTHVASLISAAFLFQFGTGPIRGFAMTLTLGLDVEPVHLDFRVEDAVRARAVAPVDDAGAQHLTARRSDRAREHGMGSREPCTFCRYTELQLRPLAMARDRAVLGHRPRGPGGDLARSACRSASSSPAARSSSSSSISCRTCQQVRTALEQAMPGVGQNALIQRYGDPAANQVMIRVPKVGAEAGGSLSQTADARRGGAEERESRQVRRWSAPRSSARASASS